MHDEIRFVECTSPNCRFRYPSDADLNLVNYCPKCGSETTIQSYSPENGLQKTKNYISKSSRYEFVVVLDNIRSMYNVGSIFRTADGFGIEKLYPCGITSTPDNKKFTKTSLGSESNLKWEYHNNCVILCKWLINERYLLICLENDSRAIDINEFSLGGKAHKVAVVVGNEKVGIDPDILNMCHKIITIPMAGIKESYNVTVAFGIMIHHLMSIR